MKNQKNLYQKDELKKTISIIGERVTKKVLLIAALSGLLITVLSWGNPNSLLAVLFHWTFLTMNLIIVVFSIENSTKNRLEIDLKVEMITLFIIILFTCLVERFTLKVFTGMAAVISVSMYLMVRSIFFIVFEELNKILKK